MANVLTVGSRISQLWRLVRKRWIPGTENDRVCSMKFPSEVLRFKRTSDNSASILLEWEYHRPSILKQKKELVLSFPIFRKPSTVILWK